MTVILQHKGCGGKLFLSRLIENDGKPTLFCAQCGVWTPATLQWEIGERSNMSDRRFEVDTTGVLTKEAIADILLEEKRLGDEIISICQAIAQAQHTVDTEEIKARMGAGYVGDGGGGNYGKT